MIRFFDRIPPAWKAALSIGLSARLVLALWGMIIFLVGIPPEIMERRQIYYWGMQPVIEGAVGAFFGVWQRWDTIFYIFIADSGYLYNEYSAFFPLYPLLGKVFHLLLGLDTIVGLSLISLICSLFAMFFLFKITTEVINPDLGKHAVVMMAFFPSAFFFFAPYPQSLGLMLILFSLWAAIREKWAASVLAGFLAGLTHSTVIPVAGSLGILAINHIWPFLQSKYKVHLPAYLSRPVLEQPPERINWFALFAPLAPMIGTGVFLLWRESQNLPHFTYLLYERWGRTSVFPWTTLLRIPEIFDADFFVSSSWLNFLCLILAVVVVIWSIRKLPVWLWVYSLLCLTLLLSQGLVDNPLAGFNRYVLFLFPIFSALASWTQGHPRIRLYLLVFLGLLQLFLSSLHMQWVWVG